MPHPEAVTPKRRLRGSLGKSTARRQRQAELRYSVGLPSKVANDVARYAQTVDTSMSKAIAALVRLGLESQETRKREFFKRLRDNLAIQDPKEQDRMVDEFRTLILGR